MNTARHSLPPSDGSNDPFSAVVHLPQDCLAPGSKPLAPPQMTGTGQPGKLPWDFLTPEQHKGLTALITSEVNRGANSTELEESLKDWLRELPDGTLARGGWQVDALAEVLALAGMLSRVVHRSRRSL